MSRVLLAFIIVIGCASTNVDIPAPPRGSIPNEISQPSETAPDAEVTTTDREKKWWQTYKMALSQLEQSPELSCKPFADLSNDTEFPLHFEAELRARQACGANAALSLTFDYTKYKSKSWLWPLALEVAKTEAHENDDQELLATVLLEQSKLSVNAAEKIDLTEQAISIANRASNKNETKKLKAELAKRLYKLAPRKKPNPTPEDLLKVAADFKKVRDFKKALVNYNLVANSKRSSTDEVYRALLGIKSTHKLAEDKPKHVEATQRLVRFVKTSFMAIKPKNPQYKRLLKRYHDNLVLLARAYWTEGEVKRAVGLLQETEKVLKNRFSLNEVYWLRGRIEEEAQRPAQAIKWFEMAESECKNVCAIKEKILWTSAWNFIKISQFKEAVVRLQKLYDTTDNPFAKPKYLFWRAKALIQMNEADAAKIVLKQIVEDDATGYYGMLAYRELGEAIPPVESASVGVVDSDKNTFLTSLEGRYAGWLLAVGENSFVGEYLDGQFAQIKKNRLGDSDYIFHYLSTYAMVQEYLKLFARVGELPVPERNQILAKHPNMVFPQPFTKEVKEASEKYGVKSELVYAIMRQESAFNPMARSPADAFGLMQLIPRVAKQAAKNSGLTFLDNKELYKPELNIPLGASFLKDLWKRYDGQFVLIAASYNASEAAIRTWINTRFFEDPIRFIEDIPYDETQGYVKLVLRNFIFYSRLNSNGESILFPEWCLANLHQFKMPLQKTVERLPASKK